MTPLPPHGLALTRRHFLRNCGVGLGKMALAGLLTDSLLLRAGAAGHSATNPLAPRQPHFPARAKRVIHLFMGGAPSQLELFDHKPELTKLEGKPLPPSVIGGQRYAFIRPDAAVLGPRFKFARHGKSGTEVSEMLPHLAKVVDDICLVRSVHTDQFNHAPAQILFNTGFSQPGRPSLGSWALYGLGAETQNLPAFVVMSTGGGLSGGSALWSSGFLPTVYTGVRFRNQGPPILDVNSPAGVDTTLQRDTLDTVAALNRRRLAVDRDPEIATRIASYEMAFQLQSSAPELMDLKGETRETLDLYGCDPDKPSFARACLLARRMIERGVRFVNVYHEGWDAHTDVAGNVKGNAGATDRASAALVTDLKRRGLLEDTLVVWGGEFGRMPVSEGGKGRDHNPHGFCMWLAGAGIKGGASHGATDEVGYRAVQDRTSIPDLHATILHLAGIDHEQLTYFHNGRRYRLTDVSGEVIRPILS